MDRLIIYCPAHITFLLHCHVASDAFPNIDAPIYRDLIPVLLNAGVIEPESVGCYRTTPLGKAWVQALCNVSCPTPAFVDEQGRVL